MSINNNITRVRTMRLKKVFIEYYRWLACSDYYDTTMPELKALLCHAKPLNCLKRAMNSSSLRDED